MESSGFTSTELDKFSAAGRTIAAAVGTSVQLWARAEAGVILKTWAGRTKVRAQRPLEVSGILRAYRTARRVAGMQPLKNKGGVARGQAGINLGLRKGAEHRVWYRTRSSGVKFQPVYGPGFSRGWRIRNNADWPEIDRMVQNFRAHLSASVSAAKGAAGLARQSIVQIADDLGIRLETVKGGGALSAAGLAKARRAIASNGQFYRNGYGIEANGARQFFITLVNRYPRLRLVGMDNTLALIIRGRLSYFRRNLEEGVFLSAQKAARAYPYLSVLKSA